MSDINPAQPANTLWLPTAPAQGVFDHGDSRRFGSVRNAIRFVMEEIPLPPLPMRTIHSCPSEHAPGK